MLAYHGFESLVLVDGDEVAPAILCRLVLDEELTHGKRDHLVRLVAGPLPFLALDLHPGNPSPPSHAGPCY